MADNTLLNVGADGDTIASDDIGGVKFQRVKLVEGADGTNDGDISAANPLPVQLSDGTDVVLVTAAGALLVDNSGVTQPVSLAALPTLAAGTANIGDVDILTIAAGDNNIGNVDIASIAAGDNNIGNVDVVTMPAVTNAGTFAVQESGLRAATAALTIVADNAASATILAANANRRKAIITNDSSARLYLRFEAAAASTSNYGVSLPQHGVWEELHYTGEIRGIWASDPGDGAARVTEFTA